MYKLNTPASPLAMLAGAALLALASGCTPMTAGQMAEAGYNVARTTLGASPSSVGADERQKRLQTILNGIEIGQPVQPIIDSMGEPPKEKSGNTSGFTCYEFSGVYSATDAAVIVANEGKVAFYGNSRCNAEMQAANFRADGKYATAAGQ